MPDKTPYFSLLVGLLGPAIEAPKWDRGSFKFFQICQGPAFNGLHGIRGLSLFEFLLMRMDGCCSILLLYIETSIWLQIFLNLGIHFLLCFNFDYFKNRMPVWRSTNNQSEKKVKSISLEGWKSWNRMFVDLNSWRARK